MPVTEPATIHTKGDLLGAYGVERTSRAELQECARETVRLVDVHNANMTSGKLAPQVPSK